MKFCLSGLLYNLLIDPLLGSLRKEIGKYIQSSDTVLDVACGPGTLAMTLVGKARHVTGIDIDDKLIKYARSRASGKGIMNISFNTKDASDLSEYHDREFDLAVTSMAIHQFESGLALQVLTEMRRVASKVIIADYNYPMPEGFSRSVAYSIEYLARGDHHRNFRNYIKKGGLKYFTDAAGLSIRSSTIKGNGVFIVVVCESFGT